MAQPFGVGDMVGGRYLITDHVVTSADQDIVFQAVDQVLDRKVSVLLASRTNAKQVATSAKELATGERASEVQVLDLGLSAERTYLISSVVKPNQLLDLVLPDSAPYVEPYFTDSLGSELFGQSREMHPHTYDDDPEYYARLQEDLASSSEPGRRLPGLPRRRPSFLDKVTTEHAEAEAEAPLPQDSTGARLPDAAEAGSAADDAGDDRTTASKEGQQPFSLRTDLEVVDASSSADIYGDVIEALYAWGPKLDGDSPDSKPMPAVDKAESTRAASSDLESQEVADAAIYEHAPSVPFSTLSAAGSSPVQTSMTAGVDDPDGEEVIDDPPAEPDPTFEPHHISNHPKVSGGSLPPAPHTDVFGSEHGPEPEQKATSFTGLIRAVPPRTSASFPAPQAISQESASSDPADSAQAHAPLRWISAALLVILVVAAAVILFIQLS